MSVVSPATDTTWLSVYIYYAEPWEALLVQAVKPFVEQAFANQWAEQFFFIRYWERGPHIRLRFKGRADCLENTLKPALHQYLSDYFRQYPSHRPEPDWLRQLPAEHQWFPNDSCQFIAYEPELERYGGPEGMLIAEQQFEASSRAVLALLAESDAGTWNYNRAMGAAIQLHLGFTHALGMDLHEASTFFHRNFQGWSPQVYQHYGEELSEEEQYRRHQEVIRVFENSFRQQKPVLLPLFSEIWEALDEGQEFEQEWFNHWLQAMRQINEQLQQAQQQGILDASAWGMPQEPDPVKANQLVKRVVLDSYIHMTNNRLGIQNRDEGYLGFLLKEGFQALTLVS